MDPPNRTLQCVQLFIVLFGVTYGLLVLIDTLSQVLELFFIIGLVYELLHKLDASLCSNIHSQKLVDEVPDLHIGGKARPQCNRSIQP